MCKNEKHGESINGIKIILSSYSSFGYSPVRISFNGNPLSTLTAVHNKITRSLEECTFWTATTTAYRFLHCLLLSVMTKMKSVNRVDSTTTDITSFLPPALSLRQALSAIFPHTHFLSFTWNNTTLYLESPCRNPLFFLLVCHTLTTTEITHHYCYLNQYPLDPSLCISLSSIQTLWKTFFRYSSGCNH